MSSERKSPIIPARVDSFNHGDMVELPLDQTVSRSADVSEEQNAESEHVNMSRLDFPGSIFG